MMKDKIAEKKILTPELWQHRIKIYEQERTDATKIVINPSQETKWRDMLSKMELRVNDIILRFN